MRCVYVNNGQDLEEKKNAKKNKDIGNDATFDNQQANGILFNYYDL